MFFRTACTLLLMASAVGGAEVSSVRKVYVSGNNEAASAVTHKLAALSDKYGEDACVAVVPKADLADATLLLNQSETSGGIGALLTVGGRGPTTTTVVSAELRARDGSTLWQESKQGLAGITTTGAANAAGKVLESLYQAERCDKKGRRR